MRCNGFSSVWTLAAVAMASLVLTTAAGRAQAQTTTMTTTANAGPGGSDDDWNNAANWNNGVPTGAQDAVISAGLAAEADTTPPAYSGGLTLGTGASLRVFGSDAEGAIGSGPITMGAGSDIIMRSNNGSSYTFGNTITLLGDAQITGGQSTSGHHATRTFNGAIGGPYQFSLNGVNNNTMNLNAANTFDGLVAYSSQNQDWRLFANVADSLGIGDVTINDKVSLIIGADAMDDVAVLTLNGPKSNKPSASNPASKLVMDASDTVSELWIDGIQAYAGVYDNSQSWLSGAGQLTVLSGAANVAPMLTDTYDEFFEAAGAPNEDFNQIWQDFPSVNYTVVFDKDMDQATVEATDFGNAGTSTGWSIGTITKTLTPPVPNSPSEFNVEVLLAGASAGTLQLQVNSGADLKDTGGLSLDTSSAIPDDTTITINAGNIPDATITGTGGGNDSWNQSGNWDQPFVPFGPGSAIVDTGNTAQVYNAPPGYAGSLTLETNATLRVNHRDAIGAVETPSDITLKNGATIDIRDGSPTFGPIALQGSTSIEAQSNGAHHETFAFDGEISGSGGLALNGLNNDTFQFNAANTFSGGLTASSSANQGFRVEANAPGSLGMGDVTINNAATLIIGAVDAMADTATLSLNGERDGRKASKLIMNADDTIMAFFLDGLDLGTGTFDQSSGLLDSAGNPLITGSGILTVTGSLAVIPEPSTCALAALGLLGLGWFGRRRRRRR